VPIIAGFGKEFCQPERDRRLDQFADTGNNFFNIYAVVCCIIPGRNIDQKYAGMFLDC
jgi:hypothetical protein